MADYTELTLYVYRVQMIKNVFSKSLKGVKDADAKWKLTYNSPIAEYSNSGARFKRSY